MTIRNMAYMQTAQRNLGIYQNQAVQALRNLSGGFRINSAADDAAGAAISEKMRGQIGGLDQAYKNAMHGISLIQTAEGAIAGTDSILGRMRELAVQAADATMTDSDRAQSNTELQQLMQELDRTSSSTHYNSKNLLDGSLGGDSNASFMKSIGGPNSQLTLQIGANGSQDQRVSFKIGDMSSDGLGIKGLNISSIDSAAKAISALDRASSVTSGQRSTLGAMQNRLESTINSLSLTKNNLVGAESTITSADMALEAMRLTQANIMNQASQSMLSQGMNLSQSAMMNLIMK
ncbi:MAG: flagellin [Oscillospiraceae bacterium]|nr:flagellin [Oscillospiraceae bacterium]